MNKFLKELLLLVLIVVPYAYLATIWNRLPDQVPTHFGVNGEPNGWSGKSALLYIPALMGLGTYLLMLVIPHLDPKKKIEEMGNKYYRLRVILALLMMVISLYLMYLSEEGSMKNPGILFSILGTFFAIMGNYLQTVRPNYFVGIRTPWTLESETVWKKTHTLCGRLWMVGGIVIVILAFVLPTNGVKAVVIISLLTLMSVVPIAYSYFEYKKEKKLVKL